MKKTLSSTCALTLVVGFAGNAKGQEHGWPVTPANEEHPLGATLGEFQIWGGKVYQHTGLDILSTPCQACGPGDEGCVNPCKCDPTAENAATYRCVVLTVSGTVKHASVNDTGIAPEGGDELLIRSIHDDAPAIIAGEKERLYRYYHLEHGIYFAQFINGYKMGGTMPGGTVVAQIAPHTCENHEYNHLHYDVVETNVGGGADVYVNPLSGITPNTDQQPPEFVHDAGGSGIGLANHGPRWSPIPDVAGACTVVSGDVDIVAGLRDRDDAGSTATGVTNIGVYNLRWRACSKSEPDCLPWNDTHIFENMPGPWGDDPPSAATQQQFSTVDPWRSDFDECSTSVNKTFMVATSGAPWYTPSVPDGSYTVTVEASDHAGNSTRQTVHTCVQNDAGCVVDLAIREGTDDTGAAPYTGSRFQSPYITANPGTADENQAVRLGAANTIRVDVWNSGSCPLPAGAEYEVCVGWNALSGSVLFPTRPDQRIGCKTESVGSGQVWEPGTGRISTFTWTPPASVLPGPRALVAWTDAEGDRVDSARPVVLDNNQAQRNIAFMPAP